MSGYTGLVTWTTSRGDNDGGDWRCVAEEIRVDGRLIVPDSFSMAGFGETADAALASLTAQVTAWIDGYRTGMGMGGSRGDA